MGLLGMPKFRRLLDALHEDRQRGVLGFVGREGSARMDHELAKPSPHTRTPEGPSFHDGDSRGGPLDWLLGYDRPQRARERAEDEERER